MNNEDSILFGEKRAHISFNIAKDFFEKGIQATKDIDLVNISFEKRPIWRLSFPICTLAFSLELALKEFLSQEQLATLKNQRKGHSFPEMYKCISPALQDSIENHFSTCRAHNYPFFNIVLKSKNKTTLRPIENNTKDKIQDALKRCDNAYINFRYLHEFNDSVYSFDFNTIIKLIHSCLAIRANELGLEL